MPKHYFNESLLAMAFAVAKSEKWMIRLRGGDSSGMQSETFVRCHRSVLVGSESIEVISI